MIQTPSLDIDVVLPRIHVMTSLISINVYLQADFMIGIGLCSSFHKCHFHMTDEKLIAKQCQALLS